MKSDELWPTYEANLQSYRNIFMSSQSILLAVGAIMLKESYIITLLIAAIAIFQICYVWMPVIYYRALLVDFHKYSLGENFNCKGDIIAANDDSCLTEEMYCKDYKIRKQVNKNMSKKIGKPLKNIRHTRRKIDITLPISMFLIWMIYIFKALNEFGII